MTGLLQKVDNYPGYHRAESKQSSCKDSRKGSRKDCRDGSREDCRKNPLTRGPCGLSLGIFLPPDRVYFSDSDNLPLQKCSSRGLQKNPRRSDRAHLHDLILSLCKGSPETSPRRVYFSSTLK